MDKAERATVLQMLETINGRRQSKWATKIQQLIDDIRHMEADNEELNQLFDLQHKREVEAIQRWQAEDPQGRALTMPDYGRLLDWLKEKLDTATLALDLLEPVYEARLEPIQAKSDERRAVLARLEWLADEGEHRCPVCVIYRDTDHTTNCPLAAALAD